MTRGDDIITRRSAGGHATRSRRSVRAAGGFTLIELMAVVGVLAMVVAAGSTLLLQANAARQRAEADSLLGAEADAAMNAIETALRNAVRRQGRRDAGFIFEGVDETLDDRPADRLTFYTVSHRVVRPGQPESDIRQIEFSVEADDRQPSYATSTAGWLRRRSDPTLEWPADEGGVVDRIAVGVQGLDIEYFDGVQWQIEWPAEMQSLPQAVRVRLIVESDAENPAELKQIRVQRVVHLPHTSGELTGAITDVGGSPASGGSS